MRYYYLCIVLSACVGSYQPPGVPMSLAFKEAAGWKIATPCDEQIPINWWQVFNDPTLNQLEEQLNINNQTLAATIAQYQQAQAILNQARSRLFPQINANFQTIEGRPVKNSQLDGQASWEPDLFGGIQELITVNAAQAQASLAQLAATRLALQTTLAQTYFQLRGLDNNQAILEDTTKAYTKILTITQNRFKAGVVSKLDVAQAQAIVDNAQAQAIDNYILRAQYEHALAVLVGQPVSEFSLAAQVGDFTLPTIPLSLPSTLLERRPDIAAAERQVAAANAQIGVAKLAYFPSIMLNAQYGYQSNTLSQLFNAPTLLWSLGLQVSETLFDGGLRQAVLKQSQALYQQTVANYRQTVLSAFQEVEDNLVALVHLQAEAKAQSQAAVNNTLALKLATNEYKAGIVDFSSVLTIELTQLSTRINDSNVHTRQVLAAVGLIKALGGGWENHLDQVAELH